MKFKRYKSELGYSYALGMAPVVELISHRPESVLAVYVHPDYRAESAVNIFDECAKRGLPCETSQKIFNIAADKENIFVLGVFSKRAGVLPQVGGEHPPSGSDALTHAIAGALPLDSGAMSAFRPHAVFVNPADAGNLGANVRTCLGFGIRDVAVIRPAADVYSPKAVRASMGALFHVAAAEFSSFADYADSFPDHAKYLFMLDGETDINGLDFGAGDKTSLVFGNEATGLPDECRRYGRGVRIPHSGAIDSLNVTVAVGVAAHAYYNSRRRRR